ncbi:MAG TPA: putative toxin-antitoxin system toxin component, PIN family [Verrucomicrobia bacterium]|nr:MAG: putative toxin-antitoxin system toxin component, PIN family [Lentisphaerae bacterium GWF2_57_35]HBA84793.1 putative toxin-antitoxin system toxin component, PIN family [Verrucomicrobiota bacterium]
MNVVVDTNVLVSGLLRPFSPPGEIVRMISAGELRLCIDGRLIAEYGEVLRRPKFQFEPALVGDFLDLIVHEGFLVAGTPLDAKLPDDDDRPFLEVAVASGARGLVTGNLKHFPAHARQGIKVLSPTQFLEFYRPYRNKP